MLILKCARTRVYTHPPLHIHTLPFCHLQVQGSCIHATLTIGTGPREPGNKAVGVTREVKNREILAPRCPILRLIPIFLTTCDFPCHLESSARDTTSCWYKTCPLPGELTSLQCLIRTLRMTTRGQTPLQVAAFWFCGKCKTQSQEELQWNHQHYRP